MGSISSNVLATPVVFILDAVAPELEQQTPILRLNNARSIASYSLYLGVYIFYIPAPRKCAAGPFPWLTRERDADQKEPT